MDYAKLCKDSESFVDMTLLLDSYRWHEVGYIIVGEKGCGKSTILSMMYYYFSDAEDSRHLFSDKNIATAENWDLQLNSRPVILFSFEGLYADTYEKMVDKILARARQQCMEYLPGGKKYRDNFANNIYTDYFLDIIEGNGVEKERCLSTLIWTEWRIHDRREFEYPILLLDEPFLPLEQARKYGFETEMSSFMQKLFDAIGGIIKKKFVVTELHPDDYKLKIWDTISISVYDRSKYILLTKEDVLKRAAQISCLSADSLSGQIDTELEDRVREVAEIKLAYKNASRYPWEQYELQEEDFPKPDEPIYPVSYIKKFAGVERDTAVEDDEEPPKMAPEAVADFVKLERQRIEDERQKRRKEEIAARRREKRRYRRPLPDGVLIPAEYLGIRKMPDVIKTDEYNTLNRKLKEYYRAWKKNPDWDGLYRYMQQVDSKQNTDWNKDYSNKVRAHIQSTKNRWDAVSWNTNGCWPQLLTRKGEHSVTSDHIKIYASTGNTRVSELFLGAVKLLLSNAQNSFAAKVSKYMRKESMCIWVRKADLVLMENYFDEFKDKLIKNLDFIAYRGKLGYSRETYSGDSHNQWQAELMKGYFKRQGSENKLELSDMYQYLIDAWNYEIRKGNYIADSFKNADAQILIILLETFFIIIKNKPFNDDNILLSDDSRVWEPLCRGRNWASVGKHYFEMKDREQKNEF